MYILVQHTISDPANTWPRGQAALASMPEHLKLHLSIPTADGSTAVCVWEADSIATLKTYLDPALGPAADNTYSEVFNKEGVALPTALPTALQPA
jgi:hypothetical protein